MAEHLSNFLNEILEINNPETLKIKTIEKLNEYGFNKFSYIGFNPPKTENGTYINSTFVQATFPKEWIEHYDQNSFIYIDPMISNAKSNLLPFCWDGEKSAKKVSPSQRRVLNQGGAFGIKRGVVIPVHAPGGEFAVMALATDEPQAEMEKLWKEKRHELHLIGVYYHSAIWENVLRRSIEVTPCLTPRELQCLEWSAKGKTLWEVSRILGVSEATAKTHIRSFMSKMDTSTKTHAVSKALVHGIIKI